MITAYLKLAELKETMQGEIDICEIGTGTMTSQDVGDTLWYYLEGIKEILKLMENELKKGEE